MSQELRKIGMYSICVKNRDTDKNESPKIISNLFTEVFKEISEKRIFKVAGKSKVHHLYGFTKNSAFENIVFHSAKYNHRPPLLDTEKATLRSNPKRPQEGEAEASHICIGYSKTEAYCVCEERQVGITIGQVCDYLDYFYKQLYPKGNRYLFEHAVIVKNDFLEALNSCKRISVATVTRDLKIKKVEDDMYDLTGRKNHKEIQEEYSIVLRAKRKSSLVDTVKSLYRNMGKSELGITKLTVAGRGQTGAPIMFNTDLVRAVERLEVSLNEETGTVNSAEMFERMRNLVKLLIQNPSE